ncbi:MAG: D-sedoheptulose-7-phosphate isomerase [Candidatus Hydrothermia bacterium]
MIKDRIRRIAKVLEESADSLSPLIEKAASIVAESIKEGHKVLWCGNGGSASQAMHFSAELTVRYKNNRAPYPSISLTADSVFLTACSNDYSFKDIFSRQVSAVGEKGDVLIAISTSGKSPNVNEAVKAAKEKNMKIIYLTGENPCEVENLCDVVIHVPSSDTPIVQECHEVVGHILIEITEKKMEE